jgi:hypothetical protein
MSAEQSNQPNQPFVPKSDRPEVKLTLDTPLSEMRVRDLSVILAQHLRKPWIDYSFDLITSPPPPEGMAGLQDVIQAVTALRDQMSKLTDQVNALQQKNQ